MCCDWWLRNKYQLHDCTKADYDLNRLAPLHDIKPWSCADITTPALTALMQKDDIDTLLWFIRTFKCDIKEDVKELVFTNGSLDMIVNMHLTFDFATADIIEIGALHSLACRNERASIEWVIKQFALTTEDVQSSNAIDGACMFNHLSLAQWLNQHYTILDNSKTVKLAYDAFAQNHFDMVRWLLNQTSIDLKPALVELILWDYSYSNILGKVDEMAKAFIATSDQRVLQLMTNACDNELGGIVRVLVEHGIQPPEPCSVFDCSVSDATCLLGRGGYDERPKIFTDLIAILAAPSVPVSV